MGPDRHAGQRPCAPPGTQHNAVAPCRVWLALARVWLYAASIRTAGWRSVHTLWAAAMHENHSISPHPSSIPGGQGALPCPALGSPCMQRRPLRLAAPHRVCQVETGGLTVVQRASPPHSK